MIEQYLSFADIAIQKHAYKNRTLVYLRQIDNTIDWEPVQDLLMKYYQTGKSKEGERAYPPLLLFKCLLLQKWFQIKSDPELESQINDSTYLPLAVISSMHTKDKIIKVYANNRVCRLTEP